MLPIYIGFLVLFVKGGGGRRQRGAAAPGQAGQGQAGLGQAAPGQAAGQPAGLYNYDGKINKIEEYPRHIYFS